MTAMCSNVFLYHAKLVFFFWNYLSPSHAKNYVVSVRTTIYVKRPVYQMADSYAIFH